ncbi:MAG: / specific adenine glycosylase [Pseudomonadota bacterium]
MNEINTVTLTPKQFQQRILAWFKIYGRKDLPWQQTKSPYRIWLSEIMLQQTQVATVIPYFQNFIQAFPTLSSLAKADIEEVLHRWSGLGYYARARNLHRSAQIIEKEYFGKFPQDLMQLQSLPGIGRTTAGAILALAFNKSASILDGNVKRVLTRVHAIPGSTALASVNKKLWSLAESYTPLNHQVSHYTQAMMDLGALICTRAQPKCIQCPLQTHCLAYLGKNPQAFPTPRPPKKIPSRATKMLILINAQQEILLEKRPEMGIWGGLWSLPECPFTDDISDFCKQHYHCSAENPIQHTPFRHTFSHFHLEITPIVMHVKKWQPPLMESRRIVWYNVEQLAEKGLAAPIKKLLSHLIL